MALPTVGERLKVLPSVTAAALENAVEKGLRQMGHNTLGMLCRGLEECSWKTALGKHIQEVVFLAPILNRIFEICTNGLIPHALLQTALLGLFKRDILVLQAPQQKLPGWEDSSLQYFNLRFRMLAGKIRDVATGKEKMPKKLDKQALQQVQALCLQINPKFKMEDMVQPSETVPLKGVLALQDGPAKDAETEPAAAVVPAPVTPPLSHTPASGSMGFMPRASGSMDFMQRATQQALQNAWAASPAKPLTKKQKEAAVQKRPASKAPEASPKKRPAAKDPEAGTAAKKQKESVNPAHVPGREEKELYQEAISTIISDSVFKSTDSRNHYTSRFYAKAKRLALGHGLGKEKAVEWARKAHSKASQLWDEKFH
ncbi:unnamed protein product [Symbiodinium sp. CCMP2592]|nr:unnamed protein product [Symbiodinium sp. CCMP2592]